MGNHGFKVLWLVLFLLALMFQSWAWADEEGHEKDKRPERSMYMALEYTGVEVPKGEDVSMDVIIYNRGRRDENVKVWVASAPSGWRARIKTYKFDVSGVHVVNGKSKMLTFEAEPDKNVGPGKYKFEVKAQTEDGKFTSSQTLVVTVREKKEDKESKNVTLNTSYPVLRGPTDAKFEFSLEVQNEMDKDKIFNLVAQGPKDWEINFKPAYEEKYISSLRLKGNQSQSVAVEVKPDLRAKPGEYPIKVRVSSQEAQAEAVLKVILTGTYKLKMGTSNDVLSLEAQRGKEANLSIYVKNAGSATNHNISFVSFKPENWKVEFKPEKIDALEPGELKQVEVIIKPAEEALVGDYSVALSAQGEKDSKNIELRVTVKASTMWGWIGIGIIVLVVVGLSVLFLTLGRR